MRPFTEPGPALLVCSLLSARMAECADRFRSALEERFGPLAYESGDLPFDHTHYYDRELGTPILRRFLAFDRLVPMNALPGAKHFCVGLEREHMDKERRLANLDPGLITPERLVLATGKNFTHRVYLDRGVWADLTLIWTGGNWLVLPWTFPDYASAPVREHLTALRRICLDKLEKLRQPEGMKDNEEGGSCPSA